MKLTLAHFEAWLDGQIAFGVRLNIIRDYVGRYLYQHSTDVPDDRFRAFLHRVPKYATPEELKRKINATNL